jgi:phosphomannomutase
VALLKTISGIRGTIGGKPSENLTPIDIVACTAAFAQFLFLKNNNPKIVIGRDGRVTGELVRNFVVNTLVSMGFEVIDLGLSTTPTVEMAVVWENAGGGIILTASHNPAEWNALKLLNEKGEFISAEDGQKFLSLLNHTPPQFNTYLHLGSVVPKNDYIQKHIQAILNYPLVNKKAIENKKYHIVVDCINSTGAISVAPLLDQLGCTYHLINEDINGKFAHNPEPLTENLIELREKVVQQNAFMGIAVDPDVDRLVLIMENGEAFSEELTLVAVAEYFLKKRGPGITISNLSSTRTLKWVTESYGGQYFPTPVGEVHVVEGMKARNALIGGEGNGGIIVPDFHYGRDALIGIGLILSFLAETNQYLSDLKAKYPNYSMIKSKIELSNEINLLDLKDKLAKSFKDSVFNMEDGLKMDLENGWVHLRKSNTEPIIRIYSEANTNSEAEGLVGKVKQIIHESI